VKHKYSLDVDDDSLKYRALNGQKNMREDLPVIKVRDVTIGLH
jgi:hypothetical protein